MAERTPLSERSVNIPSLSITKPGPKLKPLAKLKSPKQKTPIQYNRPTYSRERKLSVCRWIIDKQNWRKDQYTAPLAKWRTKLPPGLQYDGDKRPPTFAEASAVWGHSKATISRWWKDHESIQATPKGSRRRHNQVSRTKWPKMESPLYDEFIKIRHEGKLISRRWIKRTAKELINIHYPDDCFVFSHGWFHAFQKRWRISRRRLTKQTQKLPADSLGSVNSFLKFTRHVSAEAGDSLPPLSRYSPSRIFNFDETPIPFEFLSGYTYDVTGAKSVIGKSIRNGWGKRQATVILYIFADGVNRVPPKIIFHGSQDSKLKDRESHQYSQAVTVEFNPTAYNNEDLLEKFIENELIPTLEMKPYLCVLDSATFHITEKILELFRETAIQTSVIPGGCTSLLQPLDTAVNRSFKLHLEAAIDELAEDPVISSWTISRRRILITKAVDLAWRRLDPDMIRQSFKECGISLKVDGSEDYLLKIKDHETASFAGWQDIGVINELQRKIDILAMAEIESDGDEDDIYDLEA